MTKAEYIDFVRNSLQQVDQTSRFHPAQVEAAINFAMNTVFYDLYKKNPKSMQKAMERYATVVSASVAAGYALNNYGVDLTVDVVDLPRKTGGVLEIQVRDSFLGATTFNKRFVPVTTMEGQQFYGSTAADERQEGVTAFNTPVGFSYNGARKIEFWGLRSTEALSLQFYIRLIQQFKSYSSTDNVNLPYGQDERIMELVREFMGVTPPKSLINDNADG